MGRKRKRPKHDGFSEESFRRRQFSPFVMDEASAIFSKRFTFVKPDDDDKLWSLPGPDEFYTMEQVDINETLSAMKHELNTTKSSLSDKDLTSWHEHTMFTNKAGRVVPHVRSEYKPELCTQAWCKFREIVSTFDIIPERAVQSQQLNTVHLCEAPGAFITSLNHYLKCNVQVDVYWEWLGSTLNPYYEANDLSDMIPDDRFIYETLHHWYFGEDNTGDMTDVKVMKELVQECKQKFTGDVHLVTADGSIDCQVNPAEQESLVSNLHYCEVITALQCLSPAGNLVVKMFTFFEHSASCLVYFLNCMFEKVHVFKPGTSKAGNSEVYVVCLNFCAKDKFEIYLPTLIKAFNHQKAGYMLSVNDIPTSFMSQLIECAERFKQYQTETIENNVELYENMDLAQRQHVQQVRDCCLQMYIERFGVKPMPRNQQICPDLYKQDHYLRNQIIGSTKARHIGSYNDRQDEHHWWNYLQKAVDGWLLSDSQDFYFQSCVSLAPVNSLDLTAVYGKPIDRVRSSRFCHPKLLDDFNKAVSTAKVFDSENSETLGTLMSTNVEANSSDLVKDISQLMDQRIQNIDGDQHLSVMSVCPEHINSALFSQMDKRVKVHEIGCHGDDGVKGQTQDSLSPSEKSIFRFGQQGDVPSVQMVIAVNEDYPCIDKPMAVGTYHKLLYTVAVSLMTLEDGGCFIFTADYFLTRFTVGLLHIVYRCFEQIKISCSSTLPCQSVVTCYNYHPCTRLIKELWKITEEVETLPTSIPKRDILEIIPLKYLYNHKFYQTIVKMNDHMLKAQLSHIVTMEMGTNMK